MTVGRKDDVAYSILLITSADRFWPKLCKNVLEHV